MPTSSVPGQQQEVGSYLWSSVTLDRVGAILSKKGIGRDKVPHAVFEIGEYMKSTGEIEMLTKGLATRLGVSKADAQALAAEILLDLLKPIAHMLPVELTVARKQLGVLETEIGDGSVKSLDVATYVKAYVAALPGDVEERYRHRLEAILTAYVQGILSRVAVVEKLQRPMKIDGLGLEDNVAQEVVGRFDKDRDGKKFEIKSQPPSNSLPAGRQGSLAGGGFEKDNDDTEIAQVAQKAAPIIQAPAPQDIPAVVAAVCDHEAFQFSDPLLHERCQKIVESRVREVRDATMARAQFERGVDKGGLGVSGRRLSDILQRLESTVSAYEREMRKKHEADKARVVQEKIAAREAKSVAAKQEPVVDTQKVRAAIEGAKEIPPTPKPPKVIAPTMQEIAFEKRLSDPVDELRRMTLADFRRLSRDASVAATKIREKVAFLEEQGYEKKIEGVKAWRGSPLNLLCLAMTQEALMSSVAIVDVLALRTKKQEALTLEEYRAIQGINGDLRF